MKRQTSQTLPSGQVINHTYGLGQGPGASWHKVTTGIAPNFRWTKTVFDGFGRTLEVSSGYKVGSTETAVSKVVTRYTPCACSSIGKTKWVTMPIAPGDNPVTAAKTVYDAMARPNGMTQEWWDGNNSQWVNRQWVNGVSYGVAGQLMGISVFAGINIFNGAEFRFAETREYNERLQMTRQRTLHGSTVAMDLKYVFNFPNDMDPAKKLNDGRIRQRENVVSGETVSYTYDSLQRLATAETATAAWGLRWEYLWSCQPKNSGG